MACNARVEESGSIATLPLPLAVDSWRALYPLPDTLPPLVTCKRASHQGVVHGEGNGGGKVRCPSSANGESVEQQVGGGERQGGWHDSMVSCRQGARTDSGLTAAGARGGRRGGRGQTPGLEGGGGSGLAGRGGGRGLDHRPGSCRGKEGMWC